MSGHNVIVELDSRARMNHLAASNSYFLDRIDRSPDAIVGVAEGDSWFDYVPAWLEDPFRGDLLGHLNHSGAYNIYRVSSAGDTLENMVYGTEYSNSGWTPKPPQIIQTIEAIKKYKPKIFMFSGGGNDFAGAELESYLNHKESGLPLMREEYLSYMFDIVIKKTFEDLIARIKDAAPNIQIFLHGYGYPIPDGRSVFRVVPGWDFIGPWLRPAFLKKRIIEMSEMSRIVHILIDKFNLVLEQLSSRENGVHYMDLRKELADADWANELHLTASAFGKIANIFDNRIRDALLL